MHKGKTKISFRNGADATQLNNARERKESPDSSRNLVGFERVGNKE